MMKDEVVRMKDEVVRQSRRLKVGRMKDEVGSGAAKPQE